MAIKEKAAVGAAAGENQAGEPDYFQCSTNSDEKAKNEFSAALLAANKQLLAMREAYRAGRRPRPERYARLARVE